MYLWEVSFFGNQLLVYFLKCTVISLYWKCYFCILYTVHSKISVFLVAYQSTFTKYVKIQKIIVVI